MDFRKSVALSVVIIALIVLGTSCAKKQQATLPEDTLPPIELVQPGQAVSQSQAAPQVQIPKDVITVTPVQPQESFSTVSEEENTVERSKRIQTALKNANLYTGEIDGKIGPMSKKAITDFQRSKGLVADGKVGPKTWSELEKFLVTPEAPAKTD
jgi:murein L,D-transpeptidase YcbB/YkuD